MERVEFDADGIRLVGDLHAPSASGRLPGLVLTGPFTGVRDQVSGLYAKRLAAAGYVALAFDHRNFGESGGQPRRHEDPQGKLADLELAPHAARQLTIPVKPFQPEPGTEYFLELSFALKADHPWPATFILSH